MLVESLRGERAATKRGAWGGWRRGPIEIGDAVLPRIPRTPPPGCALRRRGAGGTTPAPWVRAGGGHRGGNEIAGRRGREGARPCFFVSHGDLLHAGRTGGHRSGGGPSPVAAGPAGVAGARSCVLALVGFPHAALVTATLIKL